MMTAYTDGACSGNPGPGGWGVLLIIEGEETELCGGETETTNNRMKIYGVSLMLKMQHTKSNGHG